LLSSSSHIHYLHLHPEKSSRITIPELAIVGGMKAKCVHQQVADVPSDNSRLSVDAALTSIYAIATNYPLNQSFVFVP
jgi:hypothetical protein